jgi:hypothetical protein
VSRRTRCPVCCRTRGEAPDAAACAAPPSPYDRDARIVAAWDVLVDGTGLPCVRCADRVVAALRARGVIGAVTYVLTAGATARVMRRRRRLRAPSDRSARRRN